MDWKVNGLHEKDGIILGASFTLFVDGKTENFSHQFSEQQNPFFIDYANVAEENVILWAKNDLGPEKLSEIEALFFSVQKKPLAMPWEKDKSIVLPVRKSP